MVSPLAASPLYDLVALSILSDSQDFSGLPRDRAHLAFTKTGGLQALLPDSDELVPILGAATLPEDYGPHSFQVVPADLNLPSLAGSNDGSNPKYLAAVMGNVIGDTMEHVANYLGGVIGAYSLTGDVDSTYPHGAVLAQITDGVSECDGAFIAYIDGDGDVTTAGAAFKVRCNNSTVGSGFDFGLDLQDAAHDGYLAVDSAFYKKAELRVTEDVCVKVITGSPVDGGSGTGVNVMGPGSLVVSTSTKKLYINTNTKASPTWTVVGTQS